MKRLAPVLLLLAACSDGEPAGLAGYVEGDALMMAAQDAGRIGELLVDDGDAVEAGDVLFRLDPARAALAARQAEAAAAAAGSRAEDAGSLAQAVAEAEAQYENARISLARSQRLYAEKVIAKARLDADRAAFDAAKARVDRARAEEAAAGGEWGAAGAAEALARRRLEDLEVRAPQAGFIERVYRRGGEVVAPGEPVLALLPDNARKIRFFVPQEILGGLRIGVEIGFTCSSCDGEARARISYIAREPQFTPPVIYSIEERDRLVFLVEAMPVEPSTLAPGLPVDIILPGRAP